MDIYSYFRLLADLFGTYAAGVLIVVGLVVLANFFYYFKVQLRPGKDYVGEDAAVAAMREGYGNWRSRLGAGGWFPAIYEAMLTRTLDTVDRFYDGAAGSAAGTESGWSRYWSGAALDRCLLIALVYPVMSVVLVWYVTGQSGPVEAALGMAGDVSGATRLLSALPLPGSIVAWIWVSRPLPVCRRAMWRVLRWLSVAVASAGAVAGVLFDAAPGAGVFALAVAGGVPGIGLFAVASRGADQGALGGSGALALWLAGVVAFAVAFVVAFAATGAGVFALVVAVPLAFVLAATVAVKYWRRHHCEMLIGFMALFLLAIAVLARLARGTPEPDSLILLLLLGGLPIINAVFDWASIGLTRWLLRLGLRRGGYHAFVYAVIDLAAATLMLAGLLLASLACIEALNRLSGTTIIDVPTLLEIMRTSPGDPRVWWIHLTIFTTFIPSLVNLALGGLSLMRAVPGLTRWTVNQVLPENPVYLTPARRFGASLVLTGQVVLAVMAALFVGLLVLAVLLQGLDMIGLGLLGLAQSSQDWISGL